MGAGYGTQFVRLGGQHLYALSDLTDPQTEYLKELYSAAFNLLKNKSEVGKLADLESLIEDKGE